MRAESGDRAEDAAERSSGAGRGRFIAVIGPSGVGKDSVMAGLLRRHPDLAAVRRTITRPADPGAEDHEPVSVDTFEARERAGAFALSWQAHGLCYGIPVAVFVPVEAGRDVLANLSRGALAAAAGRFPRVEVLSLTADPQVLAARLAHRGREAPDQIAARLARDARPLPGGLRVHEIRNDGALSEAVEAASRALYPRS